MSEKYVYRGTDITFDIYEKISDAVKIISEREKISFDECYGIFLRSSLYRVIQNTESTMWAENVGFLVDEFYRRKERSSSKTDGIGANEKVDGR